MLELILALLNDPAYQDRDVSETVCPLIEAATLPDIYHVLRSEAPNLDIHYSVQGGFQILSLERPGLLPLYTDELRVLISTADASCQALVFRKTL